MKQRHYHIYILLLSLLETAFGALVVASLTLDWGWPVAMASFIGCVATAIALWNGISFIPNQIEVFLGSLLNNDPTSQFPDTKDKSLKLMYKNMNRIMRDYGQTQLDLATKRLYYDRILRIMTHELRNSITPVISLSEDMLENNYSEEDSREALSVINKQCTDIKSFLDSYYRLTHLPKPDLQNVDVRQMLNSLATLYSASTGHNLSFNCAQGLSLMCDPSLIKQVINNLIKNGIEASSFEGNTPHVTITATAPNGKVRITVSDNGPGIPKDKQEEIFLPFYTSKAGGSGIGLAISRQIMQLHNGTLSCSSNENGGAVFIMDF